MKRPLTRKEKFYRFGFYAILFFDGIFIAFTLLAVYDAFSPTTYPIVPTVGFSLSNNHDFGRFDVATFATVSITTRYGPGFLQGFPINVTVTAYVNNAVLNATGNKIWYSFLNGQYWATVDGEKHPGCTITLGPPKEIELFPVNGTKGYEWAGQGTICFLYEGQFAPVLAVDNGTANLTYLQEGAGQNFQLTVVPPSEVTAYGFNSVELFLAGALVFFAIIDSLGFLRDIFPTAFPNWSQQEPSDSNEHTGHPDLEKQEPEPEVTVDGKGKDGDSEVREKDSNAERKG